MPWSDPHATWLRPFYAALLSSHPAFRTFAPSAQFDHLVGAVEREHPSQAATMRQWSVAGQLGMLLHLASMVDRPERPAPAELWRLRKGDRALQCVVVQVATGRDLRLLEGNGFVRTQLCKDAAEAHRLADQWRVALLAVGWA